MYPNIPPSALKSQGICIGHVTVGKYVNIGISKDTAEFAVQSIQINIPIEVSHFPPGTSKWNKIEHRLFSQINKNWRGRPLETIDEELAEVNIVKNDFHGEWNYIIMPQLNNK